MKQTIPPQTLSHRETVLAKMKAKITELKQKIKPKQTKPLLNEPDVKKHLVVTIDKVSKQFCIYMWKILYFHTIN